MQKKDGTLIDKATNRTYYGLYWEVINKDLLDIRDEEFVVEGSDSAKFLEEKLQY